MVPAESANFASVTAALKRSATRAKSSQVGQSAATSARSVGRLALANRSRR